VGRLAFVLLGLAAAARGAAEVWPESGRSIVLGPEAMLAPGALGVFSNPALLLGAGRWSVGAAWLEPFEVPEFARADAAAAARAGRLGVGIGWSTLGRGDWGASAATAGAAVDLLPARLILGTSLRRSTRSATSAWSADLGVWSRPAREWRAGIAARGAWRGDASGIAAEPEWEAALAWSPEPLAFGLSILRDAVGPVENRLGARLAMGPIETHLAYADRAGDESRVALGISLKALGFRLGGAQESGRELPDTKGGYLELPAAAGPPRSPRRTRAQLDWGVTAGQIGGLERGFGARAGARLRLARSETWSVAVSAAASRDPGEPSGLDEGRAALWFAVPRLGELLIGSFDLGAGRGLVLAGAAGRPSGLAARPFRAEPASDWRRTPVPALAGVAGTVALGSAARLHLALGQTSRDARPIGDALWPSGGRLHRSDLERGRRGLLVESLRAVALERGWGDGTRLLLGTAAAEHGPHAPRLAPGGRTRSSGLWTFATFESRSRTFVHSSEVARDDADRWAGSLHLRAAAGGRTPRARLELVAESLPPGFASATAWPAVARFRHVALRAEALPLGPAWSLVGGRRLEERWLAPTVTLPARREWWEEEKLALRRRRASATATLEVGRTESRRAATGASDPGGLWRPSRRSWLDAEWVWRPEPATRLWVAPSWSRGASGWRERWSFGVARRGAWSWEIEASVRPGTLVEDDWTLVEGDPLGGYRLVGSTSPTRLRAALRRGMVESEVRWSESSGRPRPEFWLTLQGAGRSEVR
jgi:hypothetical protein